MDDKKEVDALPAAGAERSRSMRRLRMLLGLESFFVTDVGDVTGDVSPSRFMTF